MGCPRKQITEDLNMAKETFQTDGALSKNKLGKLLLIDSIKKAIWVSFDKSDLYLGLKMINIAGINLAPRSRG